MTSLEIFTKDSLGVTWFNSGGKDENRLALVRNAGREFGRLLPYGDTAGDEFAEIILKNQPDVTKTHPGLLSALCNV